MRHQFLPHLDEGRSWTRARLQEKHKDTGPLQYSAKLHFTSDKPHKGLRKAMSVMVWVTHNVKSCGVQRKH